MKTYNNSKVRAGEKITNPSSHAKGYEKWVFDSIQKQIDKAKSDKGKQKYTNIQKEYVREVKRHYKLGSSYHFPKFTCRCKDANCKKTK